jgi:2-aminoadipate transaminase
MDVEAKDPAMSTFARRMSSVHRSFIREILKVTEEPGIISFAGGLPNPRFFPVKEIAEAARKALDTGGRSVLQYSTTEGYLPLREQIARRYAKKGINVGPEEILILNGSQQGLDLMGKAFLDKGDVILVERPTYLAAIQAFGMFEPDFHPISLEEDGADMRELAEALSAFSPKLFYSIPNFQNPSGISYSEEKRRETVRLILQGESVLIEDDPYGDLRFLGEELPSMRAYVDDYAPRQPGETVVLLGTFSKIVSPGLRLGWICAGKELMERLVVAKQAADLHSDCLSQRIVHHYLADNDVDKHIALIREAYGRQRALMVDLAGRLFPPEVKCTRPEGGMFLWMTLPEGMSALEMFERAIAEKVAFVPGQAFFTDGSGINTLRLNFSNSDEAKIEEGMKRLARVFAGMKKDAVSSSV